MKKVKLHLLFTARVMALVALSVTILFTSCKKDKDDDDDNTTTVKTIPSDNDATPPPSMVTNNLDQVIPNPTFSTTGSNRIQMVMTGIKDPVSGQFIQMARRKARSTRRHFKPLSNCATVD